MMQRLIELTTGPTGVLILTTTGTLLTRIVSSVILTRLLAPEIFGVVGIIGSIFFTIALLTDLGFQSYVVRHPDGDEHQFQDTIWTIHAMRGLVLALVGGSAAPLIGWLLGKPEVVLPLSIVSATFAIDGLASLSLITLLRSNRSRTLSLLDFAVTLLTSAISIGLALVFRNVWAIVVAMLLASSFKTAASYWIADRGAHRITWNKDLMKEFWAYSRLILASGFVTILINQADKFALARILSLAQYGLYTTATNLASAPQALASNYMFRIQYPIFARAYRESPDQIGDVYYTTGRNMTKLYWLGGGILIGGGSLIVEILYDPRYSAAGAYLSLLGINTLLTLSNKVSAGLLLAIGNTRNMLLTNLVRLAWILALMPLAFWAFGPIGIVIAFGTMELPVYVFSTITLLRAGIYRWHEEFINFILASTGYTGGILIHELHSYLFPQPI